MFTEATKPDLRPALADLIEKMGLDEEQAAEFRKAIAQLPDVLEAGPQK